MHGKGTFVTLDGKKYEGYWDSTFNAGVGKLTDQGKSYKTAWKFKGTWLYSNEANSPTEDVIEEIVPEDEVECHQIELSSRDRQLILTGAPVIIFKKGKVIIQEGTQNKNLYQVCEPKHLIIV